MDNELVTRKGHDGIRKLAKQNFPKDEKNQIKKIGLHVTDQKDCCC